MTIDPLIMLVVDVLSRYVVDKGATLIKEAGEAAGLAGVQLYQFVLTQLKGNPADARIAERFEENPKGYQTPIADAIAEKAKSDPDFAAQLSALLEEYRKATNSTAATNINAASGTVATEGGIAAGAGSVAVGGNVEGGITITNTQSNYSAGGSGP